LAFSAVGALTIAGLAGSYAKMLLKVSDYNMVRSEREALKEQYRNLDSAFTDANAKLTSLESLAAEVAWTYGFTGSHRLALPRSVLAMATERPSTPEASYSASVYAFDILKTIPLLSPNYEDANTPSIWPVRGPVTAGFGQRMDPLTGEGAFHAGIDIAAPSGTPVVAAADGILFHAGPDAGYGIEALIDHGFGITTKYGHLSKTFVWIGEEVKRGQVIGTVGMTGRATGPHLHYEVRIYETPVNPAKYLSRHPEPDEPNLLSASAGSPPQSGR